MIYEHTLSNGKKGGGRERERDGMVDTKGGEGEGRVKERERGICKDRKMQKEKLLQIKGREKS